MSEPAASGRDLFGQSVTLSGRGRQLPLPLGWRGEVVGTVAPIIIVGPSNSDAVRHIGAPGSWTVPASILIGPARSGKSMMGQMFLDAGGARVIDGLDGVAEADLFHLWNDMRETGGRMLILTETAQALDALSLPDLKTRLATAPVLEIGAPDACLSRDLVEHLLTARGLNPAPQLGSYVAARIERSYAAINTAVTAIDAHALAQGGAAGIRNARAALIAAGLYDGTANDSDSPEPA